MRNRPVNRLLIPPGSLTPTTLLVGGGYDVSKYHSFCEELRLAGFRVIAAPWFCLRTDKGAVHLEGGVEMLTSGQYRQVESWETFTPDFLIGDPELRGVGSKLYRDLAETLTGALLGWHPDHLLSEIEVPTTIFTIKQPVETNVETPICDGKAITVHVKAIFDHAAFTSRILDSSTDLNSEQVSADRSFWGLVIGRLLQFSAEALGQNARRYLLRMLLPVRIEVEIRSSGLNSDYGLRRMYWEIPGDTVASKAYAAYLYRRCSRDPFLAIPVPEIRLQPQLQKFPAISRSRKPARDGRIEVRDLAMFLGSYDGREQLIAGLVASEKGQVNITFGEAGDPTEYLVARDSNGRPRIAAHLQPGSDTSRISHPLSAVLPACANGHATVNTKRWPGAEFRSVDFRLRGPAIGNLSSRDALLLYLGRVAECGEENGQLTADPYGNTGHRFVEPGVGRSCMVDFLSVDGRPELIDFSVTGVGLTPYSEGGFVAMGSRLTGRAALNRAFHRQRCAEKLEAIGCRTAPIVGIIDLPREAVTMPDGSESPAALLVRGFRTTLRVKQLDPVACFYHSRQHAAGLSGFLNDRSWEYKRESSSPALDVAQRRFLLSVDIDAQGGHSNELARLAAFEARSASCHPADSDSAIGEGVWLRLSLIHNYWPLLVALCRKRLAHELHRDPETDVPSDFEFVCWFSQSLGQQLGRMARARFLHDYHQEGVSRHTPVYINTLVDNNVTLLAEFPDLDTGIFLDDPEMAEELQLSRSDLAALRDGYQSAHNLELANALSIVTTVATVIGYGDRHWLQSAQSTFLRAYEEQGAAEAITLRKDSCKIQYESFV